MLREKITELLAPLPPPKQKPMSESEQRSAIGAAIEDNSDAARKYGE